ncbi:hypothetical protein Pyn_24128 [Prunus yedoensis var. nudiflora]|uniref:RIN4 pathogenic type III effector avirulence factor Avr cleavage site domain-containing protein n=1 Tax=Prunus yedoensis var. nudiflora TaxID=2094558 RepID=A0A314ZI86_PRUYE|nr:hypothetical protein Pyn_24128 [Prunus yedoensis var. nudiflora]
MFVSWFNLLGCESDQQDYYKRSGQIPAFGDWDYANELPITQYFECARQAGLIRFSSSSGESADAYVRPADLYAVNHLNKPKPSRKCAADICRTKRIYLSFNPKLENNISFGG